MTTLQLLTGASEAGLSRLGVTGTADVANLPEGAKFDNRPTWDNTGPKFDNRPTWDNWSKR